MEESEQQCRDCLNVMHKGAKKCESCGAFYDWRRYSSQVSTILALILAAVAVFTWAEPLLKKYIVGYTDKIIVAKANVYVGDTSQQEYGLIIAASNQGDRTAYIKQVAFKFDFESIIEDQEVDNIPLKSGVVYLNESPTKFSNKKIIPAGNGELLHYFIGPPFALPKALHSIKYYSRLLQEDKAKLNCYAVVEWIDFNGGQHNINKPMHVRECRSFFKTLKLSRHAYKEKFKK